MHATLELKLIKLKHIAVYSSHNVTQYIDARNFERELSNLQAN